MKANEFMIGDWVHSLLHDVDTTITDTEGPSDGVGDHRAYWLSDMECFERHFPDEIDPIPLTKEILDKSGFIIIAGPTYSISYYLKNGKDSIFITMFEKDSKPTFIQIMFSSENNDRPSLNYVANQPMYVHELQHILRLCGIEKEIVIK